jgi:internalin A
MFTTEYTEGHGGRLKTAEVWQRPRRGMHTRPAFTLETGQYGTRAVVHTYWKDEFIPDLVSSGAVELELNHAKGWGGSDLEFLRRLPHLRSLAVIDFRIPSVEPVHALHELRSLKILTYCKTPIRFEAFEQLEDCSIHWRSRCESLFGLRALRSLFVHGYPKKFFEPFASLRSLESLSLAGGPFRVLDGIGNLSKLTHLRLAALTKLESLEGLEKLSHLEDLRIDGCRKFRSVSPLAGLRALRVLTIGDGGEIESVLPLESLLNLEQFVFDGTTNVLDGDLGVLLRLPKLRRTAFMNRRHYSLKREECPNDRQ